jgi:hypothetical protein
MRDMAPDMRACLCSQTLLLTCHEHTPRYPLMHLFVLLACLLSAQTEGILNSIRSGTKV